MGWNHPNPSLEDMIKLVKGFVDILILASGYQSFGRLAHWDALSIKKAFQWALFFENVFGHLGTSGSDVYEDSVNELDAALSEMKSNPLFPQGLAHLSSATLTTASEFVLKHLIQSLPLRDEHLKAFLTATIQMDLDELSEREDTFLDLYLSKLRLQNTSLNLVPERKDSIVTSPDLSSAVKIEKHTCDTLTKLVVLELLKRQSAVSSIVSADTGLNVISNSIRCGNLTEAHKSLLNEYLDHEDAPMSIEQFVEISTWQNWKSRNLSYFLDKRTIRLVSGASMIFSAPKVQWEQILERLNTSVENHDDNLSQTIELLSLGCIANQWDCLIEHFMSVSFVSLTVSKQYYDICNICQEKSQSSHHLREDIVSKENGILDYMTGLLGNHLHQLWKLPPCLVAAAIPSWSPLFRLYVSEAGAQLKGDGSTLRCCSCTRDRKEHIECELAERIWCLYVFHAYGYHVKQTTAGS